LSSTKEEKLRSLKLSNGTNEAKTDLKEIGQKPNSIVTKHHTAYDLVEACVKALTRLNQLSNSCKIYEQIRESSRLVTILRYHVPPSWIACCTKTRLDGHVIPHVCFVNMEERHVSAAWSKSLKGIPFFDSSFIEKCLEKDGKVPKKVITRGYSNFCEGYIFDVEGKFQSRRVVFALGEKLYSKSGAIHAIYAFWGMFFSFNSFMPILED